MGRLIDADAFDKRIRLDVGSCEEELTEDFKDGISTILEMMKTAPTVDAVPAVRGRWIHHKGGYSDHYECTACGKPIVLTAKWDFCPNCGADMRGDHEKAD